MKVHYSLDRKSPLLPLSLLCSASGAGLQCILLFSGQLVLAPLAFLPVAAALVWCYCLIRERELYFYKTSGAVWLYVLYGCFTAWALLTGIWILCSLVAAFMLGVIYKKTANGEIRNRIMFLAPTMGGLIMLLLICNPLANGGWLLIGPSLFALLSPVVLIPALRMNPDGDYLPKSGDRPDGRLLRSRDPMTQLFPYFMDGRNISSVKYEDSFDLAAAEAYVHRKRKEGLKDFGLMYVILASYCRGIAHYPGMNRFVSGQRTYSRGDDIQYIMTIKTSMNQDAPESVVKVHLSPYDTAEDVYHKLNDAIAKEKTAALDSDFDQFVRGIVDLPRIILRLFVRMLSALDYFGLMPEWLVELSPFHGSVFFTNLGSLGIAPVYHHLYEFGNIPLFLAFGMKRKVVELDSKGNPVTKRYMDIRITLDERIADGFYFASFLRMYKRLLANPDQLDEVPEKVEKDIP